MNANKMNTALYMQLKAVNGEPIKVYKNHIDCSGCRLSNADPMEMVEFLTNILYLSADGDGDCRFQVIDPSPDDDNALYYTIVKKTMD